MTTGGSGIHPALTRFAHGPTVTDRATALTDLLTDKALQKFAKTDQFSLGIDALISIAGDSGNADRLSALVQLCRIAQSAKSITAAIRNRVSPLLSTPLPPVQLLNDADDRGYVAKACKWTTAGWVLDYAIEGMVTEDTGETVRAEFAETAFARASCLAEIFEKARKVATTIVFETESPADTMAGRLTRILAVIRPAIVASLLPPGEAPGERLAELIRLPLSRYGPPTKEERQIKLAREIILCAYDLVRTRFSLATDADTYFALKAARRLFGHGAGWPDELRADLERVANSILEALLLLAKQGLTAQSLVDHLEIVVDHRLRADALLRALADNHPELGEAVRAWLRKTRVPNQGNYRNTVAASQDLRTDPGLAQALLDAERLAEGIAAVRSQVIPSLTLYDPGLIPLLESHAVRAESLVGIVLELARQRRLGTFGQMGSDIDFMPKYFEAVAGVAGARVRVLRPAVVRLREDGQPGETVMKGLVE